MLSTVDVSLTYYKSPPLVSRAVCVLKITCAVCNFAKKKKKIVVKRICEVLHAAPLIAFWLQTEFWIPSLSGIH